MPSLKRVNVEDSHVELETGLIGGHASARPRLNKPLSYSGFLDHFQHQDLTPVIGREFEGLQVTDLLNGGDEVIRDLAITSTYRRRWPSF
jgi:hypothetical protein